MRTYISIVLVKGLANEEPGYCFVTGGKALGQDNVKKESSTGDYHIPVPLVRRLTGITKCPFESSSTILDFPMPDDWIMN